MKRSLLPLLAALAVPTAAYAESAWLVMSYTSGRFGMIEKIEMRDRTQCDAEGQKWAAIATDAFYICLKGK